MQRRVHPRRWQCFVDWGGTISGVKLAGLCRDGCRVSVGRLSVAEEGCWLGKNPSPQPSCAALSDSPRGDNRPSRSASFTPDLVPPLSSSTLSFPRMGPYGYTGSAVGWACSLSCRFRPKVITEAFPLSSSLLFRDLFSSVLFILSNIILKSTKSDN